MKISSTTNHFKNDSNYKNYLNFVNTLIKAGVLERTREDSCIIRKGQKKIFEDITFGFFLFWLAHNFSSHTRDCCFVRIDDSHILFLIEPSIEKANFLKTNYHSYFIRDIMVNLKARGRSHHTCPVQYFFIRNYEVLKRETRHLENYGFPFFKYRQKSRFNCSEHQKQIQEWFKDQIKKKPKIGRMLGGFSVLLKVPAEVFNKVLEEITPEYKGISSQIERLFNSVLNLTIATKMGANLHGANARLNIKTKPEHRTKYYFETDGLCFRKACGARKGKWVIFEITMLERDAHRPSDRNLKDTKLNAHIGQKFEFYSSLPKTIQKRLSYLYIHRVDLNNPRYKVKPARLRGIKNSFKLINLTEYFKVWQQYAFSDHWNFNMIKRDFKEIKRKIFKAIK